MLKKSIAALITRREQLLGTSEYKPVGPTPSTSTLRSASNSSPSRIEYYRSFCDTDLSSAGKAASSGGFAAESIYCS
jgi:hypothetical protein